MSRRLMIVAAAVVVAALFITLFFWSKGPEEKVVAVTPSATAASTTPSASPSASITPSAPSQAPTTSASPSATKAPTTKPTTSPSTTDPTQEWGEPDDCTGEFSGFSHLAQCKVKGKTALQVFEACQSAARYFVWAQSGGVAGSAKDEISYEKYLSLSATCLKGSGFKVTDVSTLNACPEGCVAKDGKDLQYIFLRGDVDGELEPALFRADTGQVVDNSKEMNKLKDWVSQFER